MVHHKNIRIRGGPVKRKRHRKTKNERERRKLKAALLAGRQTIIEKAEQVMASMIGASLYKQEDGFTQAQLYTYGGKNDSVFTLTLREGSEGYQKYGSLITVNFVYTRDERKMLESDVTSLDQEPRIKAKLLVPWMQCENTKDVLLKEGVKTRDIVQIIVLPSVDENNTFPSKEKRTLKVLEVPFEAEGNGNDIGWIFGSLKRRKEDGVGLMPEDNAIYLAYKLILECDGLTEEETGQIFDSEGKIRNRDVAYHYLQWKNDAGIIKDHEIELLNKLKLNRVYERVELVDKILKDIGSDVKTFAIKYPKSAGLLFNKIINFRDRNFNTTGKYPLYMNFESLLHIYFRHTNEFDISEQYADRDKFQLDEKDVMTVIGIVMHALNNDYQAFKEEHPDGRFFRAGKMAYYYNGDYYHVVVNEDGRISTFYKASGNNIHK